MRAALARALAKAERKVGVRFVPHETHEADVAEQVQAQAGDMLFVGDALARRMARPASAPPVPRTKPTGDMHQVETAHPPVHWRTRVRGNDPPAHWLAKVQAARPDAGLSSEHGDARPTSDGADASASALAESSNPAERDGSPDLPQAIRQVRERRRWAWADMQAEPSAQPRPSASPMPPEAALQMRSLAPAPESHADDGQDNARVRWSHTPIRIVHGARPADLLPKSQPQPQPQQPQAEHSQAQQLSHPSTARASSFDATAGMPLEQDGRGWPSAITRQEIRSRDPQRNSMQPESQSVQPKRSLGSASITVAPTVVPSPLGTAIDAPMIAPPPSAIVMASSPAAQAGTRMGLREAWSVRYGTQPTPSAIGAEAIAPDAWPALPPSPFHTALDTPSQGTASITQEDSSHSRLNWPEILAPDRLLKLDTEQRRPVNRQQST